MGSHLIDGQFQSDKYPTTPRGKVPLSVKDPTAQDLLWEYAQRRRSVDAEFSGDLETALRDAGYVHVRSADAAEFRTAVESIVRARVASVAGWDGFSPGRGELRDELTRTLAKAIAQEAIAAGRIAPGITVEWDWQGSPFRATVDRIGRNGRVYVRRSRRPTKANPKPYSETWFDRHEIGRLRVVST